MKAFKHISGVFAVVSIVLLFASCSKDGFGNNENEKLQDGSSIVVSAGRNTPNAGDPTTRAYLDLDTYTYSWDVGDKIKLTVTDTGDTEPLASLDRLELTSTLATRNTKSNFVINSQPAMYADLRSAHTFDYYAYFPNGVTVDDSNFPDSLSFSLASTYSGIAAGEFTSAKTPMIDSVLNRIPTILYDAASPSFETNAAEAINFSFDHITSYLSVEVDLSDIRPTGLEVVTLEMTVGGGGSTTAANMINGTYTYDIANGTYTLTGGTNKITYQNLSRMGSSNRLYIPMPPKTLTGFSFHLTLTGDRFRDVENTTTSITFRQGYIHHIRITPHDIMSIGESELLYFDLRASNGGVPLKLGSWLVDDEEDIYGDNLHTVTLTPAMISSSDYALAFFKFGSVVGFSNEDSWDLNDIKFNPTKLVVGGTRGDRITDYGNNSNQNDSNGNYGNSGTTYNIPGYAASDYNSGYTNVSASSYHNGTNVFNYGKGDPCQLAGLDMNQFNSLNNANKKIEYLSGYDSGWRLPTYVENNAYVGLPDDTGDNYWLTEVNPATLETPRDVDWSPGYYQWDADDDTGIFLRNPAGTAQLPGSGTRNRNNGTSSNVGIAGNYWSGEAYDNANGYNFGFQETTGVSNPERCVPNSPSGNYAFGMAIRCVRK